MKTLTAILKDQPNLNGLYLKIKNPPYMDLVIESLGEGPLGVIDISVAHYFEQNGDLCQDPEMCFHVELVDSDGQMKFTPFMFQQAIPPVYQEPNMTPAGRRLLKQLTEFAEMWDKNLGEQGFLKAYEAAKAGKVGGSVTGDIDLLDPETGFYKG